MDDNICFFFSENLLAPPEPESPVSNARETLLDYARSEGLKNKANRSWNDYWNSNKGTQQKSLIYYPTKPTQQRTLGEILYILRPIIYRNFHFFLFNFFGYLTGFFSFMFTKMG